MSYTVIVMRPLWYLGAVAGFDTLQDLQYVATGVSENTYTGAHREATREAVDADRETLRLQINETGTTTADDHDLRFVKASDYTVLGTLEEKNKAKYMPWMNGDSI